MIVDGKKIAEGILKYLEMRIGNRSLNLTAVLVGNDLGLKKFVDLKKKAAEKIKIHVSVYKFKERESQKKVVEIVRKLSQDLSINGIFVELPLPKRYKTQEILNAVLPEKDVDLLSLKMQRKYYTGKSDILPPCVEALESVFKLHNVRLTGKTAAVFGYGMLVGKPIMHWLKRNGVRVSVIDIDTKNPKHISQESDIIISGVGNPGLLTGDMIKKGAIVVDYGYAQKNNNMVGDVDFSSVASKASLITPVPGGMGPVVIAATFKNLVQLAYKNEKT